MPRIYSDCASAFVLSNGLAAAEGEGHSIYKIVDWASTTTPGTAGEIEASVHPLGIHTSRTKLGAEVLMGAFRPMFERLRKDASIQPKDFDWALVPQNGALLDTLKSAIGLDSDQLRQSFDVFSQFGSSSTPTVLVVLDRMRADMEDGGGKDVVGCSPGPGITMEMVFFRRC